MKTVATNSEAIATVSRDQHMINAGRQTGSDLKVLALM